MSDKKLVMNFAENINEMTKKKQVREYYVERAMTITKDVFNHIVILLTMCVNKELQLAFDDEDDVSVEQYPQRVKEIYDGILSLYQKKNSDIINKIHIPEDETISFLKYLNKMVRCLLSGIRYIFKKEGEKWNLVDARNEQNTRYRREERIRDNMESLISVTNPLAGYTITHNIEIPYMYVLAWDINTLYSCFDYKQEYEDKSYMGNLRRNTSTELRHISDNLVNILLYGVQINKDKFEDGTENALMRFYKEVDYRSLLPTIVFRESVDYSDLENSGSQFAAYKNHIIPYVKKETLKRRPLLPMELSKREYDPVKTLDFMLRLMKEENKTKDYLNSDIVYIRDCITSICEKLLEWILEDEDKDNIDFIVLGKEDIKIYLEKIINAVNNVPRKENILNREDYLKKLMTEIAKEWDRENLRADKDSESCIRYAYFSVLKLTRNWNAHNLIQNVSISFVAFLFLIAIRYLINLEKMDTKYPEHYREFLFEEAKLFKVINETKIDYKLQVKLSDIENEYFIVKKNVLKSAFENNVPKKFVPFFKNTTKRKAHKVLSAAGAEESKIKKDMSENEIFLAFWLSAHMGDNNPVQEISNTKDINLIEILERIYSYQRKSFLLSEDEKGLPEAGVMQESS